MPMCIRHLMPKSTLAGFIIMITAQNEKADSTLRTSQAVPHPSTDRALRRLTSEVRRDPVHSTRYGRQRSSKSFSSIFLSRNSNLTALFSKTCQKHSTPHTQFMLSKCVFNFLQGHLDRARQNQREPGSRRPKRIMNRRGSNPRRLKCLIV